MLENTNKEMFKKIHPENVFTFSLDIIREDEIESRQNGK